MWERRVRLLYEELILEGRGWVRELQNMLLWVKGREGF